MQLEHGERVKPGAFKPRLGQRLSVYRADLATPREVLQKQIDVWQQQLSSDVDELREKATKNLVEQGSTVEELVQNRWRVARIPISELTARGYIFDSVVVQGDRGHLNIEGDYDLYRNELSSLAHLVSVEGCLEP